VLREDGSRIGKGYDETGALCPERRGNLRGRKKGHDNLFAIVMLEERGAVRGEHLMRRRGGKPSNGSGDEGAIPRNLLSTRVVWGFG